MPCFQVRWLGGVHPDLDLVWQQTIDCGSEFANDVFVQHSTGESHWTSLRLSFVVKALAAAAAFSVHETGDLTPDFSWGLCQHIERGSAARSDIGPRIQILGFRLHCHNSCTMIWSHLQDLSPTCCLLRDTGPVGAWHTSGCCSRRLSWTAFAKPHLMVD